MRQRPGGINWGLNAFLVSAAVLAVLVVLTWRTGHEPDRSPLFVYCAAGLKMPVEELANEFKERYGADIELTYGGSETMLSNAKLSGKGDLIIPADFSYIEEARHQDLIDEDVPLATMKPVVAVKKGNPKNIKTLDDLLKADVRVALANPEAAAVGKLTKKALTKINRWEPLKKKSVFKGTVPLVATDVRLGEVDAGIVWDSTVIQFSKHLEAVELDELRDVTSRVAVGVLRTCEHPASALTFARFLAARDEGANVFKKHGFVPVPDGDLWEDGEPSIQLHAGAMLRPAIEKTIRAFEQREGLPPGNINLSYNGCGVLVTQMKAGQRPDAFFACDAKYLDDDLDKEGKQKIKDLFLDSTNISTNKLVMIVHKGNPKKIRTLRDLTKKGMRIGVGDEHKCAMGALTQETFRIGGVKGQVNAKPIASTGDQLVNQFVAAPDELDAIVVYVSNALRVKGKFDVVDIDLDCAVAAQPIAAGRETNHPHLVERLIKAIKSKESQQRFEDNGFQWKATR